jgi:Leucine rich repeat
MSQYRYPGTQPFSTGQQHLFFGREEDIVRVHRMVKTQPLVLLYSKSGLGKSSLLNAGIIPEVQQEGNYTPLVIRFNAWMDGKRETPAEIALMQLSPEGSQTTFLDTLLQDERSLWHELKEAQIASGGRKRYLLIFDQFEELFSYPAEQIDALKTQLAEALYTKIPQRYRNILEKQLEEGNCKLSDTEFDQLEEQPEVRVLLSIRSDRMHLMERLSDALPDILSHCYELHALSALGAEAAISAPAKMEGDFSTPAFAYAPDALKEIIAFLDDAEGRIETVQLQILCRNFEERARQENIRQFNLSNLGDLRLVIDQFYNRQLAALGDESAQQPARRLIEEGLIVPEDKQRLTLHEAQIASLFKVSPEHLALLVDSGLLRAEMAPRGGYNYELSHDTLVDPALSARAIRKKQEENILLAEEQRKRQRARQIAFGFGFLAILSLATAVFAVLQAQKAQKAQAEALVQQKEADAQRNEAELQKNNALQSREAADSSARIALTEKEKAELLAAKGSRLEQSISGTDTYRYLVQKGQEYMLKDGDYRNALTYFATAQFTEETPEATQLLDLARKGLRAEKAFVEGDFAVARPIFKNIAALNASSVAAKRMQQMNEAESAWQKAAGQPGTSLSLAATALYTLPSAVGQRTDLEVLNLSNNQFSVIPVPVFRLTRLRELIISDGYLESVPPEIARFTALQVLNLESNRTLTFISPAIGQLKNLRVLNLKYCGMANLPDDIGACTQLEQLLLSNAALEGLPGPITRLIRLKKLDLATMPAFKWLQNLPLLTRLKSLEYLSLSGNNLKNIPDNIGQLENLTELDLSQNDLEVLPAGLSRLKALKILHLSGNDNLSEAEKQKVKTWLPNCEIF